LQFLIESSTISVIGGAIGVLCGIIAAKLVAFATPLPAAVQFWSVLSGLFVALSVGLFFWNLSRLQSFAARSSGGVALGMKRTN